MASPSLFRRVARRLDKTISSFFFIDQWVIMIAQHMNYDVLNWTSLHPLMPAKDRYWGDPFLVWRDGQYYVFVEEKIYATGLGRIACLTLDNRGYLKTHQVVLERPYHLSYPFLFEYNGVTYMMPETAGNQTVEIYRCVHFPDQWKFAGTLMTNIYAVDATLLEHDDKWWLFANVKEAGGSSLDALHLFYAENPLSTTWKPHPRNPVVRDIRSARPAGNVFVRDGHLIRPSQDSYRRYGYALQFNQVVKLDENEYEERILSTFRPAGGKIRATHTFNQAHELTVIDAVVRRRK